MAHQDLVNSGFDEDVVKQVMYIARGFLRDFPKFFQVSFDAVGRTYELGSPNIDADSLWIATYTTGSPVTVTTDKTASAYYSLDQRNGIIRFNTSFSSSTKILVEGYYYEWVLPSDLKFYARHSIEQHVYNLPIALENMSDIVVDTIGMGTVVDALWGLLTEYSRDIDVMTSESVHIPASQRYRMVQSLLDYWSKAYEKQAKALNIGLDRIEIMNLRRVSRTTNRLVPLYKARELGETGPIERIFPEISDGIIGIEEPEDKLFDDVFIDTPPGVGSNTSAIYGI
jgi:hypothetical protein